MGYPRYLLVPPGAPGVYHCTSRCVRRAFLCGEDALTGRSFEHRRGWLEERILELGALFALAVHAYAVMSNHLHLVVELDPAQAQAWSAEEVAARWLALSARPAEDERGREQRIAELARDAERIAELRQRLACLGWFHRFLKEPIARRANAEDECTGRFWEGRYSSKDALDDPAVLANMVYVDLNPVRAGIAPTPEASAYTSVRRRAAALKAGTARHDAPLTPLAAGIRSDLLTLTEAEYLDLVEWTGRSLHPGKHGAIDAQAPPVLERLGLDPERWCAQVPLTETGYCRAVGSLASLIEHARRTGRRWLRGVGTARRIERGVRTA